jgi:hypothetical protein
LGVNREATGNGEVDRASGLNRGPRKVRREPGQSHDRVSSESGRIAPLSLTGAEQIAEWVRSAPSRMGVWKKPRASPTSYAILQKAKAIGLRATAENSFCNTEASGSVQARKDLSRGAPHLSDPGRCTSPRKTADSGKVVFSGSSQNHFRRSHRRAVTTEGRNGRKPLRRRLSPQSRAPRRNAIGIEGC